jgi:hypothetical protein
MNMEVLRKYVLPLMTLGGTGLAGWATYACASQGEWMGAACCALVAAGQGYFVVRDVKKLLAK